MPDHLGISNHAREFSSQKDCEDYVDRIVVAYGRTHATVGRMQLSVNSQGWVAGDGPTWSRQSKTTIALQI